MRTLFLAVLVAVSAGAVEVRLVNATGGWDIHEVYIVQAASDDWGSDLLGGAVMKQDGVYATELSPGLYSMMVVDEDGDEYVKDPALVTANFVWEITLNDLEGYETTGSGG